MVPWGVGWNWIDKLVIRFRILMHSAIQKYKIWTPWTSGHTDRHLEAIHCLSVCLFVQNLQILYEKKAEIMMILNLVTYFM